MSSSAGQSWRARLRTEEFLFLLLFIPSSIVTVWANYDLYAGGVDSRRIQGGLLRLAIVVLLAMIVPTLDRWRHRLR